MEHTIFVLSLLFGVAAVGLICFTLLYIALGKVKL